MSRSDPAGNDTRAWPLSQLLVLLFGVSLTMGVMILWSPNGPSLADFMETHAWRAQTMVGTPPTFMEVFIHRLRSERWRDWILGVLLLWWLCLPPGLIGCILVEGGLGPVPLDARARRLLVGFGILHICYLVVLPILINVHPSLAHRLACSQWVRQIADILCSLCQWVGIVLGAMGLGLCFRLGRERPWLRGLILGISVPHFPVFFLFTLNFF